MDVESVENLKHEVVAMLVEEKIHRFDPTNGAKAYSYFQTIVKRWLIHYNNTNYKKLKQVGSFDEVQDSYESELQTKSGLQVSLSVVIDAFVNHCYDNMEDIFIKTQDQKVADAVLTLFKSRHDLDIFKKKALYIYIREMTDCDTPVLTKVIAKLKIIFTEVYQSYDKAGYSIVPQ
jgi:hypothetical protein